MWTGKKDEPCFTREKIIFLPPGAQGEYKEMPAERKYILQVHLPRSPEEIQLDGRKLKNLKNTTRFNQVTEGWYFNPEDRQGVIYIKTLPVSPKKGFRVEVTVKQIKGKKIR